MFSNAYICQDIYLRYWTHQRDELSITINKSNDSKYINNTWYLMKWYMGATKTRGAHGLYIMVPYSSCTKIHFLISMGYCKKDVTPLLTYWSYVFLALTHRYASDHGACVHDLLSMPYMRAYLFCCALELRVHRGHHRSAYNSLVWQWCGITLIRNFTDMYDTHGWSRCNLMATDHLGHTLNTFVAQYVYHNLDKLKWCG